MKKGKKNFTAAKDIVIDRDIIVNIWHCYVRTSCKKKHVIKIANSSKFHSSTMFTDQGWIH